MSARPLEVRVAVLEERTDGLEEEQLRHRQRLHDLEGDRATLKLISAQVTELTATVERTAKQAALEAIELAMQAKDDLGRKRWGLRAQWVAVGVAFGGLVVALAALFIR